MSFVPKKIVNEEAEILSECHVNKAAGLSNGLSFIYDNDTVSQPLRCMSEWVYIFHYQNKIVYEEIMIC